MPTLALLFFCLLLIFAAPARAEDSGLEGTADIRAPEQARPSDPGPGTIQPDLAPAEDDQRPPAPVATKPKESPRFSAEDHSRLQHWLLTLCRQDAVSPELANRVKFGRQANQPTSGRQATRIDVTAGNKQGTLVLMLDNYAELANYRDRCVSERKRNPQACIEKGHLPKPGVEQNVARYPFLSLGSDKFWTDVNSGRTPAGIEKKTDFIREIDEQLNQLQGALKKEFFDFRDAADLAGKPGSGALAQKMAASVRQQSTCGTRAVAERAHAQK
jgi:hypothetical protein